MREMMAGCFARACTAAVFIGVMCLPGCPFDSAWCLVCAVCRLTIGWVDCRYFLYFVFSSAVPGVWSFLRVSHMPDMNFFPDACAMHDTGFDTGLDPGMSMPLLPPRTDVHVAQYQPCCNCIKLQVKLTVCAVHTHLHHHRFI